MIVFEQISNVDADQKLVEFGHVLGACNRPFGRQSFGLILLGVGIISVAVSASTVNARCAGYDRKEVVELARCASDPTFKWSTRVCLRLWRELAPKVWASKYWPVCAVVSYQNALIHSGNLYRFDGWRKVADVPGGSGGGGWNRQKKYPPKSIWVYEVGR